MYAPSDEEAILSGLVVLGMLVCAVAISWIAGKLDERSKKRRDERNKQ